MNRRDFLKILGSIVPAAILLPKVDISKQEPPLVLEEPDLKPIPHSHLNDWITSGSDLAESGSVMVANWPTAASFTYKFYKDSPIPR